MSSNFPSSRRVAVTGIGLVSGLGLSLDEVSRSLREGRSTIRVIDERARLGFNSPLSGGLPAGFDPREWLSAAELAETNEHTQYAAIAADRAFAESGIDPALFDSPRAGVMIGNDSSAQTATISIDGTRAAGTTQAIDKNLWRRSVNSSASAHLSRRHNARAAALSVSAACSSGAHAIGLAAMMIKLGWADRMIAGGAQELCWESMAAFDALKAFSAETESPARSSRPFSKDRQGLVPSGGAAMLLLEEMEAARERGALIYGEIAAYALSADGHHLTEPSADGAIRCIGDALAQAGLEPRDIDYVNAHATSTHHGDLSEARAINAVFGEAGPPVSSTKSMTGHECWMAGASEAAYSLLMMRDGFVAPNINFGGFDEAMPRFNIADEPVAREINVVLSNSFGFGGTNASLILRRVP